MICTKLSEDYIDEVLTWLCIGAKMFYEDREKYNCIQIPEYLKQKTKESVNEMDNSGDFLEEMCDTNGNYKTNRTDIYIEYSIYAEKNKIEKLTADAFYYALRNRGFEDKKIRGIYYFKSIKIKEKQEKKIDPNVYED